MGRGSVPDEVEPDRPPRRIAGSSAQEPAGRGCVPDESQKKRTPPRPVAGDFARESAPSKRPHPLIQALIERDLDPELAERIAQGVGAQTVDPSALRKAVEAVAQVDSTLGVAKSERKIVALVGPPGAGKTAALVKLAIRYGLTARRSMHFLSTDVYRVGAAEQLRLYASILGVGFQTVDTPLSLAQALEEHRRKDLVLIDTPGWTHRDVPEILELASYLGNDPDIDVHLVLPASNRARDLARTVDRYAIFQPAKLLFTRIDETGQHGPLLNESCRTGKPVSFLSAGEQIPEDLEPATPARIAELVLGPLLARGHAPVSPHLQEVK
jgi:flagellar biosynthesis protein FlhF